MPSVVMPSVIMLSVIMPSVVMPSVIMLSVIMLSVVMPSVNMPSVIMPSVNMLSVVRLSVVAPPRLTKKFKKTMRTQCLKKLFRASSLGYNKLERFVTVKPFSAYSRLGPEPTIRVSSGP